MTGFPADFDSDLPLIQTLGIVASILMGVLAAHREAKAREAENLLKLTELHRDLWKEASFRPELRRVFAKDPDLSSQILPEEREFLNMVFVQYEAGWKIASMGGITTLDELSADARGFFSLSLPRAVWEETKAYRNPRFVKFIDRSLKAA